MSTHQSSEFSSDITDSEETDNATSIDDKLGELLSANPFLNTPPPLPPTEHPDKSDIPNQELPQPPKKLAQISSKAATLLDLYYQNSDDKTVPDAGGTVELLSPSPSKALEVLGIANAAEAAQRDRLRQRKSSVDIPNADHFPATQRSGSMNSIAELHKKQNTVKAMKLMGMNSEDDWNRVEEEVAQTLLSGSTKKSYFRSKFKDMLKKPGGRRRSGLHEQVLDAINSLLKEPYYCYETEESETTQRSGYPLDNFIRQSRSPVVYEKTHKNNNKPKLSPNATEKFSAPVGLGLMHVEFDRWWQQTLFNGEAFYSGMFFHSHSSDIYCYLQQIEEQSHYKMSKALTFIQNITKSSNFMALEEIHPIDVFSGNKTVQVSSGYSSFALVSNLGEFHVRCCIQHKKCCLGTMQSFDDWGGSLTGQKILGRRVRHIDCGSYHYGVVTDSNEIILWGNNTLPSTKNISGQQAFNTDVVHPPTIITDIPGKPLFVRCGQAHTVVVTTQGLFSFGDNHFGQLGRLSDDSESVPLPVPGIVDRYGVNCVIGDISCGANHTVVCTEDGLVFTWGANHFGQLGHSNRLLFVKEATVLPELRNVISVACGESHSVFLDKDGKVFTLGSNLFGELGGSENTLQSVSFEDSHRIVKIAAGAYSTMAMTEIGTVYQWGLLRGPNMTQHQFAPRVVQSLVDDAKFVVAIASGITHNVYVADITMSELLPTLIQCCSYNRTFGSTPLFKNLLALPHLSKCFQYLQKRAVHECKLISPEDPAILPDEAYIKLEFAESRKSGYFLVTIKNLSEFGVRVSYSSTDLHAGKYQKIVVEPDEFRIPKRGEREVKVLVIHMRPPSEKVYGIIHFTAEREKAVRKLSHCFVMFASVPRKRTTQLVQHREEIFGSLQLVKNLGTYVPAVLLKYMALNPKPPSKPHIQQFPAAILFLDISGFTSLNERLAQLGAAGPELVSKHINSYFASLIKAVSEHGGDVLKFAGDALICMWAPDAPSVTPPHAQESEMNDLTMLTLRAIQCGFDIQTRLDKYDSNEGFSLTLHIGVGSGELLSLWVGLEGSWEYLVSGEPLAQLRTAVDNSKTGEVVVSRESWEMVQPYCKGEPRGNDYWVSEIIRSVPVMRSKAIKGWPRADAEASLRCFIPMAVQVSLDSQQLEGWGNELRVATILFVKLNSDIPNDNKELYLSTINTVLCCMQQAIFKYEGMVRQFLADDKGTVLIAAFGLPPYCHVDDPLRGINSAMEIYQNLKEHQMDCSIGVTTGQVYCGSVGCPARQEYAMVGDVVNLSARLMVAAFKQKVNILCDQPTYEACRENVSYKTLEPIMVKGKQHPISIYLPLTTDKKRKSRYRRHRGGIIGRIHEKKMIRDSIMRVLDSAIKDKGTLVLIGNQGIGKSLLCNFAMRLCKRKKILLCMGEGDHFQKKSPLYACRSIITDLFGITSVYTRTRDHSNREDLCKSLLALLPVTWHDSIPLLNDLLGEPLANENEYTTSLSKEDRAIQLTQLIKNILYEFSLQKPFVILVENLHWLDSDSLSLLFTVVKEYSAILVIGTTRTSNVCRNWLSEHCITKLELSALSEQEVTQIVLEMLHVDELPPALSLLFRTTHGNPLVAREIASELLESGVININQRKCMITGNLSDITLTSVLGMIKAKLDRLPSGQQMVLKVASVIGFSFDLETLLQIYPFENDQKKFIQGELEALQMLGLVRPDVSPDGEDGTYYSFESQQLLEVAYTRLTFAQRIELHENIVTWYKSLPVNIHRTGKIAYHLVTVIENSKDVPTEIVISAIQYLEQAGGVAALAYGSDIARVWREKALTLSHSLPEGDTKNSFLEKLNRLLHNSFEISSNESSASTLSLRELSGVGGPSQHLV